MNGLERKARELAANAVREAAERVAARVQAEIPEVTAEATEAGVAITGRRLRWRAITALALRWIGGLLR